jgi:hypothetical protein
LAAAAVLVAVQFQYLAESFLTLGLVWVVLEAREGLVVRSALTARLRLVHQPTLVIACLQFQALSPQLATLFISLQ